jgi:hypothetical protein
VSVSERNWVLLFDSIHHVLAAERRLKGERIWHDLVPTPKTLSSDCGMAIEFRPADRGALASLITDPAAHCRGAFRPAENGYESVSL